MKNRIHFSKAFLPCVILSVVLILSGVVGFFVRGLNLGIDFRPGRIEEIQVASATSVDEVRNALVGIQSVSVKKIGGADSNTYQINSGLEDDIAEQINAALTKKYADNYTVLRTDYIGSSMSSSLARSSALLLLATIALIWIYATIRFHWDFALGAVIALLHDICIIFAFMVWTQLEFSTTTLAAVLTIVGYSINATVVILDRVRYNLPLLNVKKFRDLLDQSLTDTLARSIITTATTLFAVFALFLFTNGSIRDFAIAMMVGLASGCYSSIFISSAFINSTRLGWKPEYGLHHAMPRNPVVSGA